MLNHLNSTLFVQILFNFCIYSYRFLLSLLFSKLTFLSCFSLMRPSDTLKMLGLTFLLGSKRLKLRSSDVVYEGQYVFLGDWVQDVALLVVRWRYFVSRYFSDYRLYIWLLRKDSSFRESSFSFILESVVSLNFDLLFDRLFFYSISFSRLLYEFFILRSIC